MKLGVGVRIFNSKDCSEGRPECHVALRIDPTTSRHVPLHPQHHAMRPDTPGVSLAGGRRLRGAGAGGFDGERGARGIAVGREASALSGEGEALRVSVHERRAVAGGHV